MQKTTEQIIRAALTQDPTVPPRLAESVIETLRGGGGGEPETDKAVDAKTAAEMLGVTRRSVTNYADNGLIRRIGGFSTKTRARFSLRSIRDYMNGTATTTAPEAA